MSPAVKLCILASGLFLLAGMLCGVWKYRHVITRADHRAPAYVDVAHRASLLYSFASLVMAKLVEFSPFNQPSQLLAVSLPLLFFAITIITYIYLGASNHTDNQFRERNFVTTWGMYLLIVGEVGGIVVLLLGFVVTQVL